MIQRIVLVRLVSEYAGEVQVEELLSHAREVLPKMSGVLDVTVGAPADERARAWDVVITVTLDSMEALRTLANSSDHRRFSEDFLGPRMASHEAWNFRV